MSESLPVDMHSNVPEELEQHHRPFRELGRKITTLSVIVAGAAAGMMAGANVANAKASIGKSPRATEAKVKPVTPQWIELHTMAQISTENYLATLSIGLTGPNLPPPIHGNSHVGNIESLLVEDHTYEITGPCSEDNGNRYSYAFTSPRKWRETECGSWSNNGKTENYKESVRTACYQYVAQDHLVNWATCESNNMTVGVRKIGDMAAESAGISEEHIGNGEKIDVTDFAKQATIYYSRVNKASLERHGEVKAAHVPELKTLSFLIVDGHEQVHSTYYS